MNILRTRGISYQARVLATGPLVYFPLNEKNGVVAVNHGSLGIDANGTYSGASLANAPGPKGGVCPYFDGSNDSVNILSAPLVTNFNRIKGTMAIWVKAETTAYWTDGRTSYFFRTRYLNDAELISIWKLPLYQCRSNYVATVNGDSEDFNFNPNTTNWVFLVHTWDTVVHEWIPYKNGVALCAAKSLTATVYGTLSQAIVGDVHLGWVAHAALWDKVLTPTEISDLYS
jgi:hypothetical protein